MRSTAAIGLVALATLGAPSDRPGEEFSRPLGYQLGGMRLEEVRQRLGPARLQQSGDAGESEQVVCYVAAKTGIQIAFKSGELGGPENELQGFSMKVQGPNASPECLTLTPEREARLKFAIGRLRLGIAREDFRRIVQSAAGEPTHLVAQFLYQDRAPGRGAPGNGVHWDTLITVEGRFVDDKATEVSVWRVVTQ